MSKLVLFAHCSLLSTEVESKRMLLLLLFNNKVWVV